MKIYSPTKRQILIFVSLLLFFSPQAHAWTGKAVYVYDGDTITVMQDGTPIKVRLYGIDCPEKGQGYWMQAKSFTEDMILNKIIEIHPVSVDRSGRTIAWVFKGRRCLNEELLEAGLAWHYEKHSSDPTLAKLESKAKRDRRGLWSDSLATPPWEFRQEERE